MDNRIAFELLYNKTVIVLSTYALRILKDEHLVKDIIQDVFVNIYLRKEKIGEQINITGYLYNAVRYKVSNVLRDRNKMQVSSADTEKLEDIYYEEVYSAEENENYHQLENNIGSLPEKCRKAFILNYVDELSYKEIASKMNISIKTVEKHISKALRLLRNGRWAS